MSKKKKTKSLPAVKTPSLGSTPLRWVKQEGNDTTTVVVGQDPSEVGTNEDLFSKRCMEVSGVKDTELANSIIFEAARAIEPIVGAEQSRNVIAQSLHDFQPKDALEARLAAQAAVAHAYSMKSMKRCGDADMLCHIEAMANLGIKLMRVHNETVEALTRYRRGGVQQVIVHHQQNNVVADKAILNNITGGVGVLAQNQGVNPCTQSAEQNQEPTTIDHVPSQQWQTEGAAFMEGSALEPRRKKGGSE